MILDQTLKLEIVLAGNVTANQLEVQAHYIDWQSTGIPTMPQTVRVATNQTTDVTVLAAPTFQTKIREIIRLSVYNKDTATATITLKTDDGTTERIILKEALLTLVSLHFEKGRGFYKTL